MQKYIYIGSRFYIESGTLMSSIYHVLQDGETVERSDWGKVQVALTNGEEVHIRPASLEELEGAQKRLAELREKN